MTGGANKTSTKELPEREELRRQREVFHQRRTHATRWFTLRLVMGYSAIVLMTFIMLGAFYILIHSTRFPAEVVTSACAALFIDTLGLLVTIWKIVLKGD